MNSSNNSVFGFPGGAPSLPRQQQNLGFLDQRMAFDFVQKHISKFGGDPKKVTIFGQSAGARSADFHLLTMEFPPFRSVIMESGSAELIPLADYRSWKGINETPSFDRLASAVGCNDTSALLSCMKQVPVSALKEVILAQSLYFPCVYDGGYTTVKDERRIRRILASMKPNSIPVMMGTNAKEQSIFVKPDSESIDDYYKKVFPFPDIVDQVKPVYNVGGNGTYATNLDAIAAVETDFAYNCLTSRESKISADTGYRKCPLMCSSTSKSPIR